MYKQMRYDLANNLFVKLVLVVGVQNLITPRLNHAAGCSISFIIKLNFHCPVVQPKTSIFKSTKLRKTAIFLLLLQEAIPTKHDSVNAVDNAIQFNET
jgi:hypothetical protein